MAKKYYPGGFRLTLKKARELAVREFGTAKGLKQDEMFRSEGFFVMELGNLAIRIRPDMGGSGCIELSISMPSGNGRCFQLHDRETLERNYEEEEIQKRIERREVVEDWVSRLGPERCHRDIDAFWNGGVKSWQGK